MLNITINLNTKLQPMHRHDLEDALLDKFEKIELEAEPTGGGTMQGENGEIESCDIALELVDGSDENIQKLIDLLETMLAPIGSQLIVYQDNDDVKRIPFGVHEGLGLYLSNELDEDVYKNCDVNYVYQEIERLLGDAKKGHIASYWEGEETALYLYGKSFDEMHQLIKPLLDDYPLCQKCRVVKIA